MWLRYVLLYWWLTVVDHFPTEKDKRGRVDVTSLLVGLIAGGVVIVIAGLLVWYFCQTKWKGSMSRVK